MARKVKRLVRQKENQVCGWFNLMNWDFIGFSIVRQAAQRASKRVRVSRSDTDEDKSDTEGSEFKLSGDSSSDETEPETDGSNPSSDFNPFYSDSDSDAGKIPPPNGENP